MQLGKKVGIVGLARAMMVVGRAGRVVVSGRKIWDRGGAGPSAVGNTLAAIAEGSMAPRCATGRNVRAEVPPS